ncbi:MAG TPA: ORF6N domain-containing protein, partial [bacterium]|nr:ORF6N domain-containing protein [bacterium]
MKKKNGKNELIQLDDIKNRIFTVRSVQVIMDRDISELFGVETKVLNQAVKRNSERFLDEFYFLLTNQEVANLRSQFVTSSWGGTRKNPYVFTETGVAMLSSVLKSDKAVKMNIMIVKAFVSMRHFISNNGDVFKRIETVEIKLLETDSKIERVLTALESKQLQPKQGVFFDGQIFDAHNFISDLVRSAEKSIILIDNYVDDTVLALFSKRKSGVYLKILTRNVSKQLFLDMKKFNEQFPPVEIQE